MSHRNCKIVCTLGPASNDPDTISEMVEAGMSVARLNASHGTRSGRGEIIDRVRKVDEPRETPVATMVDVAGPEVRTAPIEGTVAVRTGTEVELHPGEDAGGERIGLSRSIAAVEPGDHVLLDDGRIETVVTRVEGDSVYAEVLDGGDLAGRKGVNTPGVDLGFDPITEADRRELELAADRAVEFVAQSFVRSAADVYAAEEVLDQHGAEIPIVAKIERADAVENLEGILEAAYGVMVARGDLGVELPLERVPIIQKRIIRKAIEAGTPVITATEMLDSMVEEGRPTRAEASDVANAVIDGTDAVMLSGETAIGDHPVTVVETMDRIVRDVEGSAEYDEAREQRVPDAQGTRTDALARSARYLARDVDASAVVAASESGYTARTAAQYRPAVPIVAATPDHRTRRQLSLSWGVIPRHARLPEGGVDELIVNAVQTAIDHGTVDGGDTVVVVSGMMTDLEGTDASNTLKVHVAAEAIATGRGVVGGQSTGPLYRTPDGDLTDLPDGAVIALPERFEGQFQGDPTRLAGIVHARRSPTSYPAMVAREVSVPMVAGAEVPEEFPDGDVVTLDGDRGVVYRGALSDRR